MKRPSDKQRPGGLFTFAAASLDTPASLSLRARKQKEGGGPKTPAALLFPAPPAG